MQVYPKKSFTADDLRDRNATSRYVHKRLPYELHQTVGTDGKTYSFCDGKRVGKEEYKKLSRVGAHKVDLNLLAFTLNHMPGPTPGAEYVAGVKAAGNDEYSIRMKTKKGNDTDAEAERDFIKFLKVCTTRDVSS